MVPWNSLYHKKTGGEQERRYKKRCWRQALSFLSDNPRHHHYKEKEDARDCSHKSRNIFVDSELRSTLWQQIKKHLMKLRNWKKMVLTWTFCNWLNVATFQLWDQMMEWWPTVSPFSNVHWRLLLIELHLKSNPFILEIHALKWHQTIKKAEAAAFCTFWFLILYFIFVRVSASKQKQWVLVLQLSFSLQNIMILNLERAPFKTSRHVLATSSSSVSVCVLTRRRRSAAGAATDWLWRRRKPSCNDETENYFPCQAFIQRASREKKGFGDCGKLDDWL